MATVSYVITVFNKARFLRHVAAGLRAQTGAFAREFLFVDDGSTDESPSVLASIAAELGDARVLTQANKGPAAATNAGIAAARGAYVKLVDGDDVLAPHATERLLAALEAENAAWAYMHPSCFRDYDADAPFAAALEALAPAPAPFETRPVLARETLRGAQTNPSAILARTDLLRRAGGCDERVFVQDYSLELRLATREAAAVVREPLVAIPRQTEGRISGAQPQILHDVSLAVHFHLKDGPALPRAIRKFLVRRVAQRTWAWARRRANVSPLSADFARFLAANLGALDDDAAIVLRMCETFRRHAAIRLAPADAGRGLA